MVKLILLGVLGIVLWYVLAPFITPRPLRGPRQSGKKKRYDKSRVIDGKGKVIK